MSARVVVHTPESAAGAGQYVAEFTKALAASGLRTLLFCPGNFQYAEEAAQAGVQVVSLPFRDIERAGLIRRVLRNLTFAFSSIPLFLRTIRRGDIVHFQFALRFGLGLLFFVLTRLKGARVVLTAHDPLPHHWAFPAALRWLETALLGIGYALCDRIVTHNRRGADILRQEFGVPAHRLAVIPHGPLNLEAAGCQARELPPGGPLRLLVFGSLRRNKGLHLAIAAVQDLQRSEPGRVTLTVAGRVPNSVEEKYWQGCRALIARQPAGITVTERLIEDGELENLFAAHDAVLLPYTDFHSDSGVAMLALSQAKPVIATYAGGFAELHRAADCGIAIESSTVCAVKAALEEAQMLGRSALSAKGASGKRYVMRERSWAGIAATTRQLYDEMTGGPRVVLHTPESLGSPAMYIEELTSALTDSGVPMRLVCPENLQTLPVLERNARVRIHPCAARATNTGASLFRKVADNFAFVLSSCAALLSATRRGDVVHFQYILHLPFGLAFFLCARAKRARVVFTVHDPLPHKWLFAGWLRRLEMRSLKLAYQISDVLIVHSEAGARTLREQFAIPAEKIRVIVHGPYRLPAAVRAASENEPLEILLFGSFRENKGLHLAIEAVQNLERAGVAIRLTIAGQVVNRKEVEYWQRCRTLIDPNSRAVRLKEGYIPDSELPALFSQFHCFLLPYTSFSSDSGVAYIALANGKPIVSTNAGGLGWLLENSRGGVAISDATVASVEAALRQAVALGPARLREMGRRGEQWVLAECGWPKVASETHAVYRQFIPDLPKRGMAVEQPEHELQLAGESS